MHVNDPEFKLYDLCIGLITDNVVDRWNYIWRSFISSLNRFELSDIGTKIDSIIKR